MNALRIAILVAAAIAAIAVAFFVRQAMNAPAPETNVQVEERPSVRILAARRELVVGERVDASDLYWQAWPEEALSPTYIVEGRGQTTGDFTEAVVRSPLGQGEPITSSKLVQPGDAGFMAAILTPGMRAVAVPISAETGAGGFILPNDRVDVIVSYQVDERGERGGGRAYVAQTVAENVRVLAIDQFYGEEEEVVVGETATLELTPDQARDVALAVARGEISLSLRSLTGGDVRPPSLVASGYADAVVEEPSSGSVTLYRYGRAQRVGVRGEQ